MLTREVRDALDPRYLVRALPAASLRGIGRPVEVFALETLDESGNAGTA